MAEPKCPYCKSCTLERVQRSFLMKTILRWVPYRPYRCWKCMRNTFLKKRS